MPVEIRGDSDPNKALLWFAEWRAAKTGNRLVFCDHSFEKEKILAGSATLK